MRKKILIELILKMLKYKLTNNEMGILTLMLFEKNEKELENIYNKTFEYEIEEICQETYCEEENYVQ